LPPREKGELVARFFKQLWKGLLRAIESVAVGIESGQVRILAGLDHRPSGSADRIGDVAAIEEHAFGSKSIDIGRMIQSISVCAHSLIGVVVRENEDDIRRRC